jgi:hypothetical protein
MAKKKQDDPANMDIDARLARLEKLVSHLQQTQPHLMPQDEQEQEPEVEES